MSSKSKRMAIRIHTKSWSTASGYHMEDGETCDFTAEKNDKGAWKVDCDGGKAVKDHIAAGLAEHDDAENADDGDSGDDEE